MMFLQYINDVVMFCILYEYFGDIADVGLPLPTPRFVYIGGLYVACRFGLG
jgi:hypothetical protein